MLKYIESMLSDERGSISTKRFISILGAFCLFGRFIYSPTEWLGTLIFWIVVVGLGYTSFDKYINK